MAVYFQLISNGFDTRFQAGEAIPFNLVDDLMRQDLDAPADTRNWYLNWYDIIGFALATGATWDQIAEDWDAEQLEPVVTWLRARFDPLSWYSR